MLSLLGLLGFVPALVKLGMGSMACYKAGFDTKALRPIFGVHDTDRLPADEVYKVQYIEREVVNKQIRWKRMGRAKHTKDSLALRGKLVHMDPKGQSFSVIGFQMAGSSRGRLRSWKDLYLGFGLFRSTKGDFFVILVSLICVGLTSFLVIPFGGYLQPTWSLYFATVGLSISLLTTSLMWAWVYAQEQLPYGKTDDVNPSSGLTRFACMQSANRYIIMDLKLVTGHTRYLIRVISLMAALLAIVG